MEESRRFYVDQNRMVADVEWLKIWDENPRAIAEKDFEQLKRDVQGEQFKPLLITDDGIVLGGNMRLRAYRDLKVSKVWVSILSFKEDSEGKVVAYVNGKQDHRFASKYDAMVHYSIKDNETRGFYQEELLAEQLSKVALPLDSYKLPLEAGINLSDLLKKYSPEEEVIEDETPEVDEDNVVSKLGEVYQLGRHRLMCGDSTKIEDVEKLMNGQKADMVFTDPPYGMDLDTDYTAIMDRGKKYDRVIGDSEEWIFDKANHFDCAEQIWWGADWYRRTLPTGGSWFVWDKQISEHDGLSHTGSLFELAWSKAPHKREIIKVPYFRFYGMDTSERLHPTQKPIKLCSWFIEKFSKGNEVVADLFGGSGSTLIACEQLGRTCYIMEIDPKYCDVIRKRYAKFIEKENEWEQVTPRV